MIRSLKLSATVLTLTFASITFAAGDAPYSTKSTMKIGGDGRWDYVTVDSSTHLLYVTRSTHTQVIDPSGKVTADIAGGKGLHGVALVPSANRGVITDGKGAELIVFDMQSNEVLGKVAAADDADGIIYDAGSDRVLVACGDAAQLLLLDPKADLKSAAVEKIDLGGKPEFLAADGKGRAFVNLQDKNQIAVVDLKTKSVVNRWDIGEGKSPTGLAIDPDKGRLFIGCRNEKLIVMDTSDGKVLAEVPIGKGNDACAFDAPYALASCGDGTLAVIKETDDGKWSAQQTVSTASGARTAAVDTSTHQVYLPTAEFEPLAQGQRRPTAKPGSFKIIVVGRQ
jgi:DNA-binding beta-propeller fold protein YncE